MCFAVRRGDLQSRLDPAYARNARKHTFAYSCHTLGSLVAEEPTYGTSARAVERLSEVEPRYIRITDFGNDGIELPHEFVAAESWDEKHLLVTGDMLFARSGATVGKTYLHTTELDPAVFAGYCIRFRFNSNVVLSEYVYEFTKTQAYATWVAAIQRPAGQPNINKEEFKTLELPVPPLNIQRRLVAELNAARAERDKALREADELLNTFKPWALQRMNIKPPVRASRGCYAVRVDSAATRLDPFFHAPEFQVIARAVASVPHAQLGELAGFSSETWNAKKHPTSTFNYIEISGVDRQRGIATAREMAVHDAPSRARMAVREDDILVSLTRPHHGSIALLESRHEGHVASTGFAVIRTVDASRVSKEFLWAMLRLSISLKQMERRSSGGNYPAITQDELARVVVPVPDMATQAEIVEEITRRKVRSEFLREQAELIWRKAREHFEEQLLQGEAE